MSPTEDQENEEVTIFVYSFGYVSAELYQIGC